MEKLDKDDLLEDDVQSTTGVVRSAQQDGEQLGQECASASTRVRKKYEALRKKLSGAYSHVRSAPASSSGRGSRP